MLLSEKSLKESDCKPEWSYEIILCCKILPIMLHKTFSFTFSHCTKEATNDAHNVDINSDCDCDKDYWLLFPKHFFR